MESKDLRNKMWIYSSVLFAGAFLVITLTTIGYFGSRPKAAPAKPAAVKVVKGTAANHNTELNKNTAQSTVQKTKEAAVQGTSKTGKETTINTSNQKTKETTTSTSTKKGNEAAVNTTTEHKK